MCGVDHVNLGAAPGLAGLNGVLALPATAIVRRLALRGVLGISVLSLVCNIGILAPPLFNMQVFNRVLPTRDLGTLQTLMLGLAIWLLAYAVLDIIRVMALEALAGNVTRRLALPLLRAAATGTRGTASQALADLETLRGFFSSPACTAPFDAMWTPLLLLVLLLHHWGYAALGLASCLILVGLNALGDVSARREMLAANEAIAGAFRQAADVVGAAEAVLGNGMLPALVRRWSGGQMRAAGLVHRAVLRARAVTAAITALRMGMTGAMVALGLVLVLAGHATTGSMVAANMILARLLLPFLQLSATKRQWIDAAAAWRRVRTELDEAAPKRYAQSMPAPFPRLVVERLVYLPSGGDRSLLRGVSFTVEPGESLGIIGPSAAGKTTLVRAIMGQIQPTAGGVYLDGTSTWLWEREDFARHVGFVPQGLALLEESVAANIARLALPDFRRVIEAARHASAHRIIAGLPNGYATRITGGALSSGQRQRVTMARALYGRPGVLVMDEPSAFLDREGEADLTALLGRLRQEGVTVVIITHRPGLLATVDKLLVLNEGVVTQFGAREEVMAVIGTPRVQLVRNHDNVAAS